MTGKLLLVLTLCLNVSFLQAQSTSLRVPYYDALFLKAYCDKNGGKFPTGSFDRDLINYYFKTDTIKILDSIDAIVKLNPFLKPLYLDGGAQGATLVGSALGQASSLNVTNFADGVAKFLVERAKEELFIAFIQKFQNAVDTKYYELNVLFPNTVTLMKNVESAEFSNILNTLREAFDKDLTNLLGNIINLNDSLHTDTVHYKNNDLADKIQAVFDKPQGKVFLAAVAIANGFVTNQKVPDVFQTVAGKYILGSYPDDKFRNALQLFNILSYSIRNNSNGKSYVSLSDFQNLWTGGSVAGQIYLGLMYQQIKNAGLPYLQNAVFSSLQTDRTGLLNYMGSLVSQSMQVDTAINNLLTAKRKGEKDFSTYWAAIFESANQFLAAATNIKSIDPSLSFPKNLDSIFSYSSKALDIAHDIAVKNYNAAVVGTLNEMVVIIGNKDPKLTEVLKNFVKYYSFAANVVSAKNSDDVKNALEAVALPAGSYSIKRTSRFNLSINGYLGGYFGSEYLPALKTQRSSFSYGLSAPVGLAMSWGKIGKKNKGNSFTVFVPLIDVGALAAYRTQNDSSSYSSQVTLQNIIAPGLFLYWGFSKCPLSLGVGGQLGPQLRSISAQSINVDKNYYFRFGVNLVVDIPFFNLDTRKN